MSRQWQEETDKKKKRPRKAQPSFRGFVNHTPTAQDKKEFRQYEIVESFEENLLPSILDEGYRVSFSYDQQSSAFQAAISTKDAGCLNHGLVLTARSGFGAFQAGLKAMFLHYIVFEEVWPDPTLQADFVDEWAEDSEKPVE